MTNNYKTLKSTLRKKQKYLRKLLERCKSNNYTNYNTVVIQMMTLTEVLCEIKYLEDKEKK